MKIFTKIFLSVFCFVVVVVSVLATIMIYNQVVFAKQELVKQVKTTGDFLSTQIEIGYVQSQLPYESLSKLSKSEGFKFWWIVKDDGIIYRADDTAFMDTVALDYFPEVGNISPNEPVYFNLAENYGIYISNLTLGSSNWKFWYGFSTSNIGSIQKTILINSALVIAASLGILGIFLYHLVHFFIHPIKALLDGVKEVSKGNLDYTVKATTKDEIGQLAAAFSQMTVDLKKSKQALEDYNKTLEQQVADRTSILSQKTEELERMNKLMVDRELKMVELKKRINELEHPTTPTPPSSPETGGNPPSQ